MKITEQTLRLTAAAHGFGGNRRVLRKISAAIEGATENAETMTVSLEGYDRELEIVHTPERMQQIQNDRSE